MSDLEKSIFGITVIDSVLGSTEGTFYESDAGVLTDTRTSPVMSSGNSGLSFGLTQLDVANNGSAASLFNALAEDAYENGRITSTQRDDFEARAAEQGLAGSPDAFTLTEQTIIQTEILEPGKAAIAAADSANATLVLNTVDAAIDAVNTHWSSLGVFDPTDSNYYQAVGQLASWANRTGDLNTMQSWLTGGTVAGLATLTHAPTLSDITNYLAHQAEFVSNPSELDIVTGNISRGENYLPSELFTPGGSLALNPDLDPAFQLSTPLLNSLTPWASAPHEGSPLIIDLSSGHTGIQLTTFNAATTSTFFDIEGTGYADQTAWTSGTTSGFLVDDLNSNGKIDNVGEMFGSTTVDGFAKLAGLDSNHDLKIDSHDAAWSFLQIWVDENGNGITDTGELHSLSGLGIASIDLANVTSSGTTIDGNPISHSSTVTFSDGSTGAIDDAWFVHSGINSYYNDDYTLDSDTLSMPALRGYGTISDLTIAMSQDTTLKGLVSDFVSEFATSGFAASTLDSDAANILYEWAGVAGVDAGSRGSNIDARQLEFMEKLFDQQFQQWGQLSDPLPGAAADIEQSWHMTLQNFEGYMLLQAGGNSLFANAVTYNPYSGTVIGDTSLSETSVEALATGAPSAGPANLNYWVDVAEFINSIKGIDNVTSTEAGWLNTAIASTDSTLSWSIVSNLAANFGELTDVPGNYIYGSGGGGATITGTDVNDEIHAYSGGNLVHGGYGNDTIYGSDSGDTLYGDVGNDTLYGGAGVDALNGGDGNDKLYGYGGNDTLNGGVGGNFVYGGAGNDTYVYSGGNDYIDEQNNGGTDQITMPSGVTLSDLSFARVETGSTGTYNDMLITIAGGGTIQINNQFDAANTGYHVETIVFSDSSTLDLSTVSPSDAYLADGGATISWTSSASISIHGGSGNDTINTYWSNPSAVIDGGAGNDTITTGTANDTFIASAGFDTINDAGGTDTIVVPAAYAPSDVTFLELSSASTYLVIDIAGLGEIKIPQFYSSGYEAIENLHFLSDNSTIAISDQTIHVIGTSGNDSLTAPSFGASHFVFNGNGGNDSYSGGNGNNTYVFSSGFGNSTISQSSTSGTNVLHFIGVDPSHIRMWTDSSGHLHLQDTTDTSHSISFNSGTITSDESAIGNYLSQITFDDVSNTVWNIADGLHLTEDNSSMSLYGTPYNDTLTAGTGSGGSLQGYDGSDTYVLSSGFGNQTITESPNTDTNILHFVGIDPSHIRMWTDYIGYLHIQDTADTSHSITITASTTGTSGTTDESKVANYIQQITFDDVANTVWNLASGLTLTGDNAGDNLYGTSGNDTITGGTGNDDLYGNGGADTLVSKGGNDLLIGGTGNDTYVFASGFGTDSVSDNGSAAANLIQFTGLDPSHLQMWTDYAGTLHLQDTTDTAHGITITAGTTGTGNYESTIGNYFSQISFDDGTHTVLDLTEGLTLQGSSSLYGTSHNDTLIAGTGSNSLYGNRGDDTYVFSSVLGTSYISDNSSAGSNSIQINGIDPSNIRMWTDSSGALHLQDVTDTSHSITVYAGITGTGTDESTIGSYFSQIAFDDAGHTAWDLTGGLTLQGNQYLYGSSHNDTLIAGTSSNSLYGNRGDDTYEFSSGLGTSYIYDNTSAGANSVQLNEIDPSHIRMWTDTSGALHLQDTTDTGHSITIYAGTTGTGQYESTIGNYFSQVAFNDVGHTTWDLTGGLALTGTSSGETLYGTAHNDTLVGLAGNDTLYGNSGDDTLYGGVGSDYLYGGTGNDTYVLAAGDGADTINESLSQGNDTLHMSGFSPSDVRMWTDTSGYLHVASLANPSDNVTITAGTTGSGQYESTVGNYVENITFDDVGHTSIDLTGGLSLTGTSSGESLYGTAHNDTLTGLAGNDVLYGNAGNDILYGGDGADLMYGGSGADTFKFEAANAFHNVDTIEDFNTAQSDKLDIVNILDGHFHSGTDVITNFVQIQTSGSNSEVYVDTSGTGTFNAADHIATILGVTGLTDEAADVTAGLLIAA